MAVSCYERYKGISGTAGKDFSIGYVVQGTTSPSEAISQVLAIAAPAVVSAGAILQLQPLKITEQGGGVWYLDADYKLPEEEDEKEDDDQATPLAFKLSWDTSGGTAKLTESLTDPDGGGIFQDTKRVIGWDGKKVNGCDVIVPALAITADVFYDPREITHQRITAWSRATGKTNKDPWLRWEAGECLLMGCTGNQTFSMLNGKATQPAPVSFKIGCSENIPGPFTIKGNPDLVANGGKNGWQYLDVYYSEQIVGSAPNEITVALPERFKLHTVYPEVGFRQVMGIG